MNIAAFVVSVVAVCISVAAVVFARKQAKAAEDQNRISGEQLALAKAESEKYRIPWRFEWRSGDTYALVNDSDDPEYDVQVMPPQGMRFNTRTDGSIVGPREPLIIMGALSGLGPGRQMTVTWRHQPDGEQMTWHEWLPTRPKGQ